MATTEVFTLLAAQIKELAASLQPQPPTPAPRMPRKPSFARRDSQCPFKFLERFDAYAKRTHLQDNEDLVAEIITCLEGEAAAHLREYPTTEMSYTQVCDVLRHHYGSPAAIRRLKYVLHQEVQPVNQPAPPFIWTKYILSQRIYPQDSEEDHVARILELLRPEVAGFIRPHKPSSINELCGLAANVEESVNAFSAAKEPPPPTASRAPTATSATPNPTPELQRMPSPAQASRDQMFSPAESRPNFIPAARGTIAIGQQDPGERRAFMTGAILTKNSSLPSPNIELAQVNKFTNPIDVRSPTASTRIEGQEETKPVAAVQLCQVPKTSVFVPAAVTKSAPNPQPGSVLRGIAEPVLTPKKPPVGTSSDVDAQVGAQSIADTAAHGSAPASVRWTTAPPPTRPPQVVTDVTDVTSQTWKTATPTLPSPLPWDKRPRPDPGEATQRDVEAPWNPGSSRKPEQATDRPPDHRDASRR